MQTYETLFILSIICGTLAFLITYFTMPYLISKLKKADVVGKDIHKFSRPEVAEMGGIGILFGFIIAMFIGLYAVTILGFTTLTYPLIISLVVILVVGIIGMTDDLILLSYKEKLILLFLAGIPLVWIAPDDLGWVYYIAIPLGVTIASNLTNMLAGMNGIETGLGIIALTSLSISCLITGKSSVAILSLSMLGSLIAFLFYNKYPARVFPGDVGTLIIGATIAAIAFTGRLKIIAIIVLIPNIIDGLLKFRSAGVIERHKVKPTEVTDKGMLIAPPEGFNSLIRVILKNPKSEKQVTYIVWGIGIIFGLLGIIIAYIAPFEPYGLLGYLKLMIMP